LNFSFLPKLTFYRNPSIVYVNGVPEFQVSGTTLELIRKSSASENVYLRSHDPPFIAYRDPAYILEDGKGYDLIDPSEKKRSYDEIQKDISDLRKEVNTFKTVTEQRIDNLAKRQKTSGSTNYYEFGDHVMQIAKIVIFDDYGLLDYNQEELNLWKYRDAIPGREIQCEEAEIQNRINPYFSALKLEHLTYFDGHNTPTLGKKKPDCLFYLSNADKVPSNIVVVGEIKTNENLRKPESRGQLATYLHRVIQSSPYRNICYGFLTDGHEIAFMKATFSEEDEYSYEVTDFVPFFSSDTVTDVGYMYLLSLLRSDPNLLGWSIPTIKSEKITYNIQKNIGRGKTSDVFASNGLAVKFVKEKYSNLLKNELGILEIFKLREIARIPQIVDVGNNFFVMQPCGEKFRRFTQKSFSNFFDTLHEVHKIGYVHRDIRSTNLITFKEDVYLIDWGYACEIGKTEKFVGDILYASSDILEDSQFPSVITHPSHDLHMLTKMVYLNIIYILEFKDIQAKILKMSNINEKLKTASDWWKNQLGDAHQFKRILSNGSQLQYEKVKEELIGLLPAQ